jgi:hypothetical protein
VRSEAMEVYVCYTDLDDRTEFTLYDSEDKAIGHFEMLLECGDMTVGELYEHGWITLARVN